MYLISGKWWQAWSVWAKTPLDQGKSSSSAVIPAAEEEKKGGEDLFPTGGDPVLSSTAEEGFVSLKPEIFFCFVLEPNIESFNQSYPFSVSSFSSGVSSAQERSTIPIFSRPRSMILWMTMEKSSVSPYLIPVFFFFSCCNIPFSFSSRVPWNVMICLSTSHIS